MYDKVFVLGEQIVDLSNIELSGRIIDIGGGGEGVIGQIRSETPSVLYVLVRRKETGR